MKHFFGAIIILISIAAFGLARVVWPFPAGMDQAAKDFFTIVTLLESLFLGFGLFFVLQVFTKYKHSIPRWNLLDWLTFFSISWILISGYFHDNSHITHEAHIEGLISIEIGFHGTLAFAAVMVTMHFLRQLGRKA